MSIVYSEDLLGRKRCPSCLRTHYLRAEVNPPSADLDTGAVRSFVNDPHIRGHVKCERCNWEWDGDGDVLWQALQTEESDLILAGGTHHFNITISGSAFTCGTTPVVDQQAPRPDARPTTEADFANDYEDDDVTAGPPTPRVRSHTAGQPPPRRRDPTLIEQMLSASVEGGIAAAMSGADVINPRYRCEYCKDKKIIQTKAGSQIPCPACVEEAPVPKAGEGPSRAPRNINL